MAAVNPRIIRESNSNAGFIPRGDREAIASITTRTTPQEFDQIKQTFTEGYDRTSEYLAVQRAIESENLLLALHIIVSIQRATIGNTYLANEMVNETTLLIRAMDCKDTNVGYEIAKTLIPANGDVNMIFGPGYTPLFYAVHVLSNERFARLLLTNGAIVAKKPEDFQRTRSYVDIYYKTPDEIAAKDRAFQEKCIQLNSWTDNDLRLIQKAQEIVPSLMQLAALSARKGKVDLNDPYLPAEMRNYVLKA